MECVFCGTRRLLTAESRRVVWTTVKRVWAMQKIRWNGFNTSFPCVFSCPPSPPLSARRTGQLFNRWIISQCDGQKCAVLSIENVHYCRLNGRIDSETVSQKCERAKWMSQRAEREQEEIVEFPSTCLAWHRIRSEGRKMGTATTIFAY